MQRAYYSAPAGKFLKEDVNLILGTLALHHQFALEDLQRDSWISQIQILKEQLSKFGDSYVAFEYAIPRMGKRVDVVILKNRIVFVLEFKVGEHSYTNSALDQVLDYALDLKNFHEKSRNKLIVPIVVATEAKDLVTNLSKHEDGVFSPLKANKHNLRNILSLVASQYEDSVSSPIEWIESIYKPTPTIIEAAQALYRGHNVEDITRADSGAINLGATSEAIEDIIDFSKANHHKSICFITGVPGAGKTLAGLNIANKRHNVDEAEHAVFLSGNGPLVKVLQEALARNEVLNKREAGKISKAIALSKTRAFIQNIHHFRDDALQTDKAPIERVVIFDEAQRAWTLTQTSSFMSRKKGIQNFNMSEPEFLISVLDRHVDWAVIVCLIGGGQEINTGEAGLPEWFSAIRRAYSHWFVYISDQLGEYEYIKDEDIYSLLEPNQFTVRNELHLSVSLRSYRSEKLSAFVKSLLDLDRSNAKQLYSDLRDKYPIVLTRDIDIARNWLKYCARGNERMGIIASSGAYRLKPHGIHVKAAIDPKIWFLNDKDDVRSSNFLEDVATEFDVQGLELDWTCIAWDANLRISNARWEYKDFQGTKWQNIKDETRRRYLLNTYRVLLTRARQGMVIFVPEGNTYDRTRLPEFYDPTFHYLKDIGLPVIKTTKFADRGTF